MSVTFLKESILLPLCSYIYSGTVMPMTTWVYWTAKKNPSATEGETATEGRDNYLFLFYLSERLVNPRPFLVRWGFVR